MKVLQVLRIGSALLMCVLLLVLTVFSRYIIEDATTSNDRLHEAYLSQIHYAYLGFGLMVLLAVVPYRLIVRFAPLMYFASILLLIACFIPIFSRVGYNAHSWVRFGPLSFEPGEFAKLAYILFLAAFLKWRSAHIKDISTFIVCGITALIPFSLLAKQPALGSAMVFIPVFLVTLFVAGTRTVYILGTLAAMFLLVGGVYYCVIVKDRPIPFMNMKPFQILRIKVFFDPTLDPKGAGYQSDQSLIAVGSGGFDGKGYMQGTQSRYGYLPSTTSYNDLIFSVVGEDFGFRGGAALILAECAILLWCLSVAAGARDMEGALVAVGVTAMFFTHAYVNVGMTMKVTPITGIPLPFISYGGTFLVSCLAAMGVVFSVSIQTIRQTYLANRNEG